MLEWGALSVVKCICPPSHTPSTGNGFYCVTFPSLLAIPLLSPSFLFFHSHSHLPILSRPLSLSGPHPKLSQRLQKNENNCFITPVHSLNWFDRFYCAYDSFNQPAIWLRVPTQNKIDRLNELTLNNVWTKLIKPILPVNPRIVIKKTINLKHNSENCLLVN